MKYLDVQIKNALELIQGYNPVEPFHIYLKNQFRINKNWGGRDRKNYRTICYTYWRNFEVLKSLTLQDQVTWLRNRISNDNEVYNQIKPFFKLSTHLSNEINQADLNEDFLREPPVFFAVLNHKISHFNKWIAEFNAPFEIIEPFIYKFPAGTNLDILIDSGVGYIQDLSCQLAMQFLKKNLVNPSIIWDCCCGAGGKAIDLRLIYPNAKLYCSDKRHGILQNLNERFDKLELPRPITKQIDLLKLEQCDFPQNHNLIVADLPCTGSGTWRRNPENLAFFNEESMEVFTSLQKSILINLTERLLKGQYFYFMTCSIFEKENEVNRDFLLNSNKFKLIENVYFGGPKYHSDFIYGCLLEKI